MRRTVTKDLVLSATTTHYLSIPDTGGLTWKVVDMRLISDSTFAIDGTNNWKIEVFGSNGSTSLDEWNNDTGGDALTAGVPFRYTIGASKGTALELDQSGGQSLKAVCTKTSSPTNLVGELLIELEAVA